MLLKKIKKSFVRSSHIPLLLISLLMSLSSGFAYSADSPIGAKAYQNLMKLNGLVAHTYINSLLYFDGDQRAKEGMQESIVDIDALLFDLNSMANSDEGMNVAVNTKWQAVKKEINSMPEETGYSYFYLERLSGVVDELTATVNDYLNTVNSSVTENDSDIYKANSEVLKVVSIHLSSAIMDIGNDDKSRAILARHCASADRYIEKVTTSHLSVKSYVYRSWRYIQGPICKTGKKGGEYTIAHFSKQISKKLQNLYGVSKNVSTAAKGEL